MIGSRLPEVILTLTWRTLCVYDAETPTPW
jgi:hypothetical protein